jgi:hypothetical protein
LIAQGFHTLRAGFESESGWAALRLYEESDIFNKPRWHTDGYYVRGDFQPEYKALFSPVGETTLCAALPVALHVKFLETQRRHTRALAEVRELAPEIQKSVFHRNVQEMTDNFGDDLIVDPAPKGFATILRVGDIGPGIHAEAPVGKKRVFASFVPGTAAEINQLRRKHHGLTA